MRASLGVLGGLTVVGLAAGLVGCSENGAPVNRETKVARAPTASAPPYDGRVISADDDSAPTSGRPAPGAEPARPRAPTSGRPAPGAEPARPDTRNESYDRVADNAFL